MARAEGDTGPVAGRVRVVRRVGFLLVAMVVAVVATAGPASAHAVLERSDPTQGASLQNAPSRVVLTFSESVQVDARSITVISATGQRVDAGNVQHGQSGNQVVAGLRSGLANGTYVVSWHVISADSHPVSGGFYFGVGVTPDATAATAVSTSGGGSTVVGVLASISRFVAFIGLSVLLGAGFFLLALWPAGLGRVGPRRLLWAGWGSTLGAAVAALLVQGPYGAGLGLSALARWDPLSTTLHGRFGHLLLLRILALLLAVPLLRVIMDRGRRSLMELAGLALVAAVTQAVAGHGGVGDDAWLATANLTLHLLGVAVWVGGLALLVVFLRSTSNRVPADGRNPVAETEVSAARAAELGGVLPRWSRTAMTAVAVVVVTGAYQTWREVGTFPALTATTYGRLLLLKLWFVAMMLGVGWLGHRWVVRCYRPIVAAFAASRSDTTAGATAGMTAGTTAMTGVAGRTSEPSASGPGARPRVTEGTVAGLRRGVMFETGLAAVVLAVTATLVNSVPARTSYVPPFADTVFAGPLTVQVDISPTTRGPQTLHIYTFDPAGKVQPLADASAQLSLPDVGVGPLPVPLTVAAPGHAIAQRMQVPLPGTWQLRLTLRINDFDQYVTTLFYRVR